MKQRKSWSAEVYNPPTNSSNSKGNDLFFAVHHSLSTAEQARLREKLSDLTAKQTADTAADTSHKMERSRRRTDSMCFERSCKHPCIDNSFEMGLIHRLFYLQAVIGEYDAFPITPVQQQHFFDAAKEMSAITQMLMNAGSTC